MKREECRIDFNPDEIAVIKEVYDNENAHDLFGEQLEQALEGGFRIIVIEPNRLGDETYRWITVGNCLHKTAVLSGLGSFACGLSWPDCPLTYAPFGLLSFICTGLYTVSWQFDPCVQYQVCTDSKEISKYLPLFSCLTSASPVILIRKSDKRRKILHCTITAVSTIVCVWNLYRLLNY